MYMMEFTDLADGPFESDDSFTLTVVRNAEKVVLGRKMRGFGEGQLVLPGGKNHYYLSAAGVDIVPGRDNAQREVREEVGFSIDRQEFTQVGVLHIATEDDNRDISIFEADCQNDVPTSSAELATTAWYAVPDLPYDEMPQDYKLWLPSVLSGYAVTAYLETDFDRVVGGSVFRSARYPLGRLERVPVDID